MAASAAMFVFEQRVMSDSEISDRRRGGAFFGRKKGHELKRHQAELMRTLLPTLAVDLAAPAPAQLATLFPHAVDEVRLEIGFGGGEHLAAQAVAHPNVGFIGCEPFL